ncbi:MAG: type II toxin-antitoxin system death-on-curing family toxin [Gemmatimonadota bacterium]
MTEPRWLTSTVVLAIHTDQTETHGGSLGLRDEGLLASALQRSRNRFHYEPNSHIHALAAAYGFGIAQNHPFIDGNKRVAFQAMYVFLGLNGYSIDASEESIVALMLSVASGEMTEPQLTTWLEQNTVPR